MEQIGFFNEFDIILLCETWLKPNHPYDMNLKDFDSICISRSGTSRKAKRGSGGLMCYFRKEIKEGIEYIAGLERSEDRLWIKINYVPTFLDLIKIYICVLLMHHLRHLVTLHLEPACGIF